MAKDLCSATAPTNPTAPSVEAAVSSTTIFHEQAYLIQRQIEYLDRAASDLARVGLDHMAKRIDLIAGLLSEALDTLKHNESNRLTAELKAAEEGFRETARFAMAFVAREAMPQPERVDPGETSNTDAPRQNNLAAPDRPEGDADGR